MSGYWIAFGWFLASIGIFGLLICKKRKRITAHTYGIIMPGIATVTVVLAVGQVWQVYRSDATQTYIHNELQTLDSDRERIKGRLRALQDRIKSNNAARDEISQPGNLTPTTDPDTLKVRAERVAAFQKESSAIQEEGKSVSQDSQALKERADAVQSDLNELRIARSSSPCNGDADPSRRDFHQPYSSEAPCQTSRTWNRPDDALSNNWPTQGKRLRPSRRTAKKPMPRSMKPKKLSKSTSMGRKVEFFASACVLMVPRSTPLELFFSWLPSTLLFSSTLLL